MAGRRCDFDTDEAARQAAAAAAMKAFAACTTIVLIGVVVFVFFGNDVVDKPSLLMTVGLSMWFVLITAPFIIFFGECIGWVSLWLFGQSSLSMTRGAEAMALLVFFTVIGWTMVCW